MAVVQLEQPSQGAEAPLVQYLLVKRPATGLLAGAWLLCLPFTAPGTQQLSLAAAEAWSLL